MRPPPGFTLLEVLLALLIITIGLLGLAGTLGPVSALAGEGRIHGRLALFAASRLALLRAGQLAGAPACAVPAAGVAVHADGVVERWTARAGDGFIEVEVQAGLPGGRRGSVGTTPPRLSCPCPGGPPPWGGGPPWPGARAWPSWSRRSPFRRSWRCWRAGSSPRRRAPLGAAPSG